MKVIIDTNVLISAILRNGKPKIAIIYILNSLELKWVGSLEILEEYKNVLKRPKFKLSETIINEWLEIFEQAIDIIEVDVNIDFPRDRKDVKFLACAIVSQADYLIYTKYGYQKFMLSRRDAPVAQADYLITGKRDFEEITYLLKPKIILPRF